MDGGEPERASLSGKAVIESLLSDLRHGLRGFRLRKSFSAAMVLTLGLGLGAVCLIFSVINSVLLRPLDFPDAQRLDWIGWRSRAGGAASGPSLYDLSVWNSGTHVAPPIAGYAEQAVSVVFSGSPRQLPAALISGEFFQLLGQPPARGRWILPADDVPGGELPVVLSDDAWRDLSSRSPKVLGTQLSIDGMPAIVVGVMSPQFAFPASHTELWLPIRAKLGSRLDDRMLRLDGAIAREPKGAHESSIKRELIGFSRRASPVSESASNSRELSVISLRRVVVGDAGTTLLLLLGVSALVLVVTCVNAGSLLIARESGRRHELALRRALGARARDLVQQLVVESVLFASIGAVAGAVIIVEALPLIRRMGRDLLPRATEIKISHEVLFVAALLICITAVGVVIAPALSAARIDPALALKGRSAGLSSSREVVRAREYMVAIQVALTFTILAAAAVLGKSVALLLGGAPGLNSDHVLTTVVQRPLGVWIEDQGPMRRFGEEMIAQLDGIPGVRMSAIGLQLPTDDYSRGWMRVADASGADIDTVTTVFQVASNDYFGTLGIPVLAGRAFDSRDAVARPPTLVLSENIAHRLFGTQSAVGKTVFARSNDEDNTNVDSVYQIVGVVGDIRPPGPSRSAIPHVYIPFTRMSVPHMTVLVRSSLQPNLISPAIDRVLLGMNDGQPLRAVRPLDDLLAQSAARPRFYLLVLGGFALLSLLLTTVGIYGVTTFTVRQRSREIGIRVSLGASRGEILLLILRDNARPLLVGTFAGILGALASSRLLTGLLSGVNPNDPFILLGVAILLLAFALAASLIPAFRATRVDPLVAMRAET